MADLAGVLNVTSGVAATPDSVFQTGSITKVWTTTLAMQFLDRVGERRPAVVDIGPAADDVPALAGARASADRALRVLGSGSGTARRVARLADVQVEALLLELRDLVATRGDRPTGPVARLFAYDEQHCARGSTPSAT